MYVSVYMRKHVCVRSFCITMLGACELTKLICVFSSFILISHKHHKKNGSCGVVHAYAHLLELKHVHNSRKVVSPQPQHSTDQEIIFVDLKMD